VKPVLYLVRALPGADLGPVREHYDVRGGAPRAPPRERLVEEARDAVVLAPTYIDRVDAALLDALPALRHVASYGVGTNHLDLDALRRRRILVTNTPGVLTDATADHALALLLAAARRVAEGDRVVRRGGWTEVDPAWMLGTEVTGKTLGIVGFGRIGQAVARRARGFELSVLFTSPRDVAFPGAARKRFVLFSAIEAEVLGGRADAGVIIHESRFTYAARGLVKLLDLGEHWERETRSPVPLGGIVARRGLDPAVRGEVDRLIRRSLELANADRAHLSDYVRRHAQEMDEAVMRQHVDLYVNDFSLGLGPAGRRAVEKLIAVYRDVNPGAPPVPEGLFSSAARAP